MRLQLYRLRKAALAPFVVDVFVVWRLAYQKLPG